MKITQNNYYTKEANEEYLSVSQYKDFAGTLGECGCEARAMAKLKGEWVEEPTPAMMIGSYVDAYFEGTLEPFKEEHPEIFTKTGSLRADFQKADEIIERVIKDPLFMRYMNGEKQVI